MDIPNCPNCGSHICSRQPSRLTVQKLMMLAWLFRFRCVRCRADFYRFGTRNIPVFAAAPGSGSG